MMRACIYCRKSVFWPQHRPEPPMCVACRNAMRRDGAFRPV